MNECILTMTKYIRYIALFLFALASPALAQDNSSHLPLTLDGYTAQIANPPVAKPTLPGMPDLSGYTDQAIAAKIPAPQQGKISIKPLKKAPGLKEFSEKSRLKEFSTMQGTDEPHGIVIESGAYDLQKLLITVNNPDYLSKNGHIYSLRIPLLIGPEATLVVSGKLNMSSTAGSLIANAGTLFFSGAEVTGWDEITGSPSVFKDKNIFRPFIVGWDGSETYVSQSHFKNLGYNQAKSYGFTLSSFNHGRGDLPPALGWLINNTFEDFYYGFYSYEADDTVIIGNTYKDNILYGIDPHDRSNRLIIAYNKTHGTKERHGIIVSREVNDSWILHNKTWNNGRSGIMIDRNSRGNVLAYNESYNNLSDGITIFESPDNVIFGNKLHGNKKNGLRVRNSWNIQTWDNEITDNYAGFEVYADELKSKTRDFEEDPYTQRADITVIGGTYFNNEKGLFKFINFDSAKLKNIDPAGQRFFRGELKPFNKDIEDLLEKSGEAGLEFKAQIHQ